MERETTKKQEPPVWWVIWTMLGIIMLIGAVVDVNVLGLLLWSGGEDGLSLESLYLETPGTIYYNTLRFAVCGWAIYGLYITNRISLKIAGSNPFQAKNNLTYWFWFFLIIAIIFSPVIPLRIARWPWLIIDIIAIVLLIGAIFLFRLPKLTRYCDYCGAILDRGYYRNYDSNNKREDLCIWCVNEKRRDDTIEIDPRNSKARDDGDNLCMCTWCANEGCALRDVKLFENDPEERVVQDKEPIHSNNHSGGKYIVFKCESCGQNLRVPLRKELLKITCPACYSLFLFCNGKKTEPGNPANL